MPYPVPANLKAEVVDRTVTLSWDGCESGEYDLSGYRVYYNGTPLADLGKDVTSYTVSNVRDNTVDFYVTSLWGADNEESRPSETLTVELPDGIQTVGEECPVLMSFDGGIEVSVRTESMVSVFTLGGSCLYSSELDGVQRISLDKGVYIVRINGRSYKAVVR